ncbi:hypothetical protein [Oceanisphaera psychrotolerans]|uniref:Nucleoside recognition protein n=1 Tax=Oceanisphaera psychrotolerans TaxID=1414654 RepID=A0A1J4Q9I5_9GAMM|nr:hypothetical protein [Oceanisphaera psychrotolerans]OIN04496.1 hypothetical protein BFR47_06260 [Oceanisphaera psychrotolerans]
MMPLLKRLTGELTTLLKDTTGVYLTLLKVMLPALLLVKTLDMLGGTQWLAWLLSPLMQLMGLPDSLGLVWATVLLTNIYTAMLVFFEVAGQEPLTAAQLTILGTLMLLAHSLPVEGAVAKRAGVSWRATLAIRIGGALTLGMILNGIYSLTGWLQTPGQVLWQPQDTPDAGLLAWTGDQLITLLGIFPVILALLGLLRLLRLLGIENAIHALLFPVLRLLGIGREAANITIIGVTLGLSYGAGLLIREANSGRLSRRDIFLTLSFLGLCHSIIEDTLLILLLGADLSGILWARLIFSIVVIAILARLPSVLPRPARPVTED